MSAQLKPKSSHATASANIKRELARAFLGIRFSVRSKSFSGGNSVDVEWTLGPTAAEVEAVIDKYQYGDFDGMDDSYRYRSEGDSFRATHGSAKYVHAQRHMPEGLFERMCRDLAALQGVEFVDVWQREEGETIRLGEHVNRTYSKTSFPAGAEYVGVAHSLELELTGACGAADAYRIVHSLTDEDAEICAVIRREFDYIQSREQKRETEPCGIITLGPGDLRLPCMLRKGQGGFCDTGR